MSRIDQALERARQTRPDAIPAGTAPEGAPADALFIEPWDVGQSQRTPAMESKVRALRPAVSAVHHTSALEIHPDLQEKIVSTPGTPALAIEQYRRLTTKLHHAQLERQVKRLMVISAAASEGKTLTSINIALTLSRSHKRRVLMIDADLRRPSLHEAFGVPGEPGLREAVLRPSERAPIIQFDDHLALLPAGKPTTDPLQILTAERTRTIVNEAGEEYDWVVIDTAPLALLPDANVLSDLVDAAVLVISAGRTSHDLVLKAVRLLGRERILGVVLNGVDPRDANAAQYYAHYYTRS